MGRLLAIVAVLAACRDEAPAPAPRPQAGCAAACSAARTCGIALTTCEADCAASPELRGCLERASRDCAGAASCGFALTCGAAPSGTGSCRDAVTCQRECAATDIACGCRCAATMDPMKTWSLVRVYACAMNCKLDEACIRASCGGAIGLCIAS